MRLALIVAAVLVAAGCQTGPSIVRAIYDDTGLCPHELELSGVGAKSKLKGTTEEVSRHPTSGVLKANGKTGGGSVSLVFDLTGEACEDIGKRW